MIDFSLASVLTYDRQSRFFGQDTARFGVKSNFKVEGWVTDLTDEIGRTSGIWTGVNNLIYSSQDWQPIQLNGISFGNARVLNWSFSENTWTRYTRYTANLETYESGNLSNLNSSPYYSGVLPVLTGTSAALNLLDSIDETFSFSQGRNNLGEATHNLNVRYLSGDSTNPIVRARYLASILMGSGIINNSLSATGLLYNLNIGTGLTPTGAQYTKHYFTESYNQVTFNCSFSERWLYDPSNKNYFISQSQNVLTNEAGITNVVEQGNIRGLVNPVFGSAQSGYFDQISGAYSRCANSFNSYCSSGFYPLINEPIENGIVQNKFNGILDYKITFTNDPRMNSGYRWEYTDTINTNNEIVNVEERGKIIGMGRIGDSAKYNRAISGFNIVYPGVYTRLYNLYTSNISPTKTLNQIAASNGREHYKGVIDYSYEYSDDTTLLFDGIVNKKTIQVQDNKPFYGYSPFNIFGTEFQQGKEILQESSNATVGQKQVDVTYNYKRPNGNPNVNLLFNYFKSDVAIAEGGLSEFYVSNCNFEVSETDGIFKGNATINYTKTKQPGDNSLNW